MGNIVEWGLREEDILGHDLRIAAGRKTGGSGIQVYDFV
jgi:hypothetical protein